MTRLVAVMFSYVEDQKGRPKWKTYALQHKPHASSSRCAHYLRPTVSSFQMDPIKHSSTVKTNLKQIWSDACPFLYKPLDSSGSSMRPRSLTVQALQSQSFPPPNSHFALSFSTFVPPLHVGVTQTSFHMWCPFPSFSIVPYMNI